MSARIAVVVSPRASSNQVAGWRTDSAGKEELHIRVTAAPEGGKATKAVCALLARELGVSKSSVACVRGGASRHKQIEVEGLNEEELRERLR